MSSEKQVVYQSVRQQKLKSKSRAKFILWSCVALVVLIIGYVGVKSISAANNVLSSNITLSSLINQSPLKQTDGVTNILLLGKGGSSSSNPAPQLTDTIMLVRYRASDKKVAMISIPRDLSTTFPNGGQGKINAAYSTGYNSIKDSKDAARKQKAGADAASAVVAKIAGVPVHYSVTVDFNGFKDLVDNLGGVTVNVEKALNDPRYPADNMIDYAPFKLAAGVQKMDGKTALRYARSRETTSDFDRAKRQQNLIYAIKDKMLSLGVLANPVKFSSTLQSLGAHISTTFSPDELKELTNVAQNIKSDLVINKVIDNDPKTGLLISEPGSSDLVPKTGNFTQIQSFVKNIFNESSASPTASVKIEVYNATGEVGKAKALADKLEKKGYKVAVLEKYDTVVDKSFIEDGTSGSAKQTVEIIGTMLGQFKTKTTGSLNTIRIIVGKDYAV